MENADSNLFERAFYCLLLNDPKEKVAATLFFYKSLLAGKLKLQPLSEIKQVPVPGRPAKPELVDPRQVPRRGFSGLKARLALAHAIAHIEFNAINLALDAVYRFQHMPRQFYLDWCRVAAEEAQHYTMLSDYLENHGMAYGEQTAHNGLWEMAEKTADDVMVRMALVPRVLEARGLDVTPLIQQKLAQAGDANGVSLLDIIFRDEVGHVAIGSRWFRYLCEDRQLDPESTFFRLVHERFPDGLHGPYNLDARAQAGFSASELKQF